jgi:hypothetical protein
VTNFTPTQIFWRGPQSSPSRLPSSSGSRATLTAIRRFVFGEHLGLHRLGFALSRANVDEGLAVGVADDVAAGHLVGAPGRREALLRSTIGYAPELTSVVLIDPT